MSALPQTPSFRLEGKKALVTGASSGIGYAAAAALADAGAEVVAAARRQELLEDLASTATASGISITPMQLDLADLDAMQAAVNAGGPFDILVNAAGMARHGPALETKVDDYDAVMAINTRAAFFLAKAVAGQLIEASRPGAITTISSQMAVVGGIERAVYCASKAAVEGFTRAMAIEWGPHRIRINTICPTFIRTALTESTFQNTERRQWVEDKIKLGRVGVVEDIMGGVVYLSSDAAALVTGTSLLIDGGWTAD